MSQAGPRAAPLQHMGLEIQEATHGTSVARTGMSDTTFPSHCRAVQPNLGGWEGRSALFWPLPFPQPPALAPAEEPHAAAGEGCPAPHAARPRPHVCGRSGGSSALGHPNVSGAACGLSLQR